MSTAGAALTPRQTERPSDMKLTGRCHDIFPTYKCKRQQFLHSLRYLYVITNSRIATLFLYRIIVIFRWTFFLCKLYRFGIRLNCILEVAYTPFFRWFDIVLLTLIFQVWCYTVNPRFKTFRLIFHT